MRSIFRIMYSHQMASSLQGRCLLDCYQKSTSGGRTVERRTVNRGDGGSIPPTAVLKFRLFRSPHICLSFGRDTKSLWSLLSGVYARGSKIPHTGGGGGGKCVTCSGLTNSRWTLNALQRTYPVCGRKRKGIY